MIFTWTFILACIIFVVWSKNKLCDAVMETVPNVRSDEKCFIRTRESAKLPNKQTNKATAPKLYYPNSKPQTLSLLLFEVIGCWFVGQPGLHE